MNNEEYNERMQTETAFFFALSAMTEAKREHSALFAQLEDIDAKYRKSGLDLVRATNAYKAALAVLEESEK